MRATQFIEFTTPSNMMTEVFDYQLGYDMFGWIDPKGKIILATPKDAKDSHWVVHETMLQRLGIEDMEQAYNEGWVRWFIKSTTMYFNVPASSYYDHHVKERTNILSAGVKIEEVLAADPKNFKHFIGTKAQSANNDPDVSLMIFKYIFDLETKYITSDSLQGMIKLADNYIQYIYSPEDDHPLYEGDRNES